MGSGARCSICNHKSAALINRLINEGQTSQRKIGETFGVSHDAVRRHVDARHAGVSLPGEAVEGDSTSATPAATGDERTPREALTALIVRLEAQAEGQVLRSDLARELRLAYNDLAKMGATDLAASVTRVADLDDWNEFSMATFKALEPFPDARRALSAAWAQWFDEGKANDGRDD